MAKICLALDEADDRIIYAGTDEVEARDEMFNAIIEALQTDDIRIQADGSLILTIPTSFRIVWVDTKELKRG